MSPYTPSVNLYAINTGKHNRPFIFGTSCCQNNLFAYSIRHMHQKTAGLVGTALLPFDDVLMGHLDERSAYHSPSGIMEVKGVKK
jgi:hypothetical protein